MEREIKFRAYNAERDRYYYEVENAYDVLVGCTKTGYTIPASSFGDIVHNYSGGWVLEQFTGLKDKNGVEIYEGDLFKFDYDWNYEVIFKDGAFGYYGEVTGDFYPFVEEVRLVDGVILDMEIIGNIHENKELLK